MTRILTLLASLLLLTPALSASEPPATDKSPNDFVAQLAGEWNVVNEVSLGPDQEKMRVESRESARLLGPTWLVASSNGEVAGMAFESLLTLGYDTAQKQFVCNWIDSMQSRIWTFTGQLDDNTNTLTLETQGPDFADPDKTTSYRLIIECSDPNQKMMRSRALMPDGNWFEFETLTCTRVN